MAKKNPWDDVIQFDEWNTKVKEEIQEDEPTEQVVNNSVPQEIQPLELEEDGIDLMSMISNLNADNASYVESAKEEEQRMLDEERQAQEEAIRQQREERLREQFELESAERDRIAFEEAQAHAEEVRRKQEKSLKNKANKLFGLKPKKKAKKDEEPEQAQETEITISDSPIDENMEVATADVNDPVGLESAEQSADVSADNVNDSEEDAYIPPSPIVDEDAFKASKEIAVKRKKKKVVKEDIQDEESESSVSVPEETVEANVETEIEVEEQPKTPRKKEKPETLAEDAEEEKPSKEKANDKADSSSETEKKEKRGLFSFGKPKKATPDEPSVKPDKKEKQQEKDQQESSGKASVSKPDWEYLATHDELTGLFNQRAYEEDKQKERKKPYVIVFIDVNNLKYANDNFGHAAGNKLIVAVADEMKKLFPNCAYRIGGDEFVAIWECGSVKKIEKEIEAIQSKFHESMEKRTKAEEEYALIYAASFGYSYTDGSKSFQEVSDEADKAMYAAKDAYKKAHPQLDMRGGGANKAKKKKKDEPPKEYDELLTKEQRALKSTIKDNHRPVSVDSTQQIIMDVQARAAEVVAILIASPTFDQLFIIHDPNTFIGIVMEMESMIDYSYLYILYEGGPQYKGSDEYLSEVTHIFEAIGNGIKSGRIRNEKDIQKIKGINVFKKIFVDM